MYKTTEHILKRGDVLVSIDGYCSEENYMKLFEKTKELLAPDEADFSADSLGIGGFLRKDGLLLKSGSDCPWDCCCFMYDPRDLTEAEVDIIKGWIDQIVTQL